MKSIRILLILLIATSCADDALFNAGPTVTKEIALADFSVIEAKNIFEIELVSDTINKVLVTCGENLQSHIHINVTDGVLNLDHDIKNDWSRKYEKVKLKLHSKPFSSINVRQPVKIFNRDIYKGSSFVLVDWGKYSELDMNVDVNFCEIVMSSDNFGHFNIKGRADDALVWEWGSSIVRADSLITGNCTVLHRGMGDVYVNATNRLDVSLEFSGNIYYYGNPSQIIIEHRTGSGMLLKK